MITQTINGNCMLFAEHDCLLKLPNGAYTRAVNIDTLDNVDEIIEIAEWCVGEPDYIGRSVAIDIQLDKIAEWFRVRDYIPNKVMVGEWEATDPRFVKYCEERKHMRKKQDALLTEKASLV